MTKKMHSKKRPAGGPIFTNTTTDKNSLDFFNSVKIVTLLTQLHGKEFHDIIILHCVGLYVEFSTYSYDTLNHDY